MSGTHASTHFLRLVTSDRLLCDAKLAKYVRSAIDMWNNGPAWVFSCVLCVPLCLFARSHRSISGFMIMFLYSYLSMDRVVDHSGGVTITRKLFERWHKWQLAESLISAINSHSTNGMAVWCINTLSIHEWQRSNTHTHWYTYCIIVIYYFVVLCKNRKNMDRGIGCLSYILVIHQTVAHCITIS